MDSPLLHSSQRHRMRANSSLSVQPIDSRGAVHKRSPSRHRSISTTQLDRLHHLALQQSEQSEYSSFPPTTVGLHWLTPQPSPQPQLLPEPSFEHFPEWTVPTPPRSDSGIPTLPVDSNEVPVTSSIGSTGFSTFEHSTTSGEMSSLGFLLPSQYGSGNIESEPNSYVMDQNYMPPMRISQPTSTSGAPAYTPTLSSSPALYQSKTLPANSSSRRHSELPNPSNLDPSYLQSYRRTSSPYEGTANHDYSMTAAATVPSVSGLPPNQTHSPNIGASSNSSSMAQYNTQLSRSPNLYDPSIYGQPFTTAPPAPQHYVSSQSLSYPPPFVGSSVSEVLAKPLGGDSSIRVLNQRPKPQCWEHGCNGRQFSTFSNLLRHQREKSGSATKSYCPKCGAEFTRTTARNGHLAHDKCTKQRRPSEEN